MNYTADKDHRLAVRHLLSHARAAIFGKMGRGKTTATIAAFDGLRVLGLAKAMLVVAPMRVANLTWPNEVEKWDGTRHLKVANLRTAEGWAALLAGTADIYTINYEAIPKLCRDYLAKRKDYAFDVVVFDELTAAKNPQSKRINQLRAYLDRVQRRWGLTGTPTPNSLLEIYGQIRLLDDGARFGPSFDRFKRSFFFPTDYMEYDWEPFEGAEEKIYSKIADIALTLMDKSDTDAPDPIVEDVLVHLPEEALGHYKALEECLVLMIESGDIVAQSAGVLVNKLLQVTGGAVYATVDGAPSRNVIQIHDAKIKALQKICVKKNSPMLIACNYQHEEERIIRAIPGARAWPGAKEEKKFLTDWNARKIPYIVAHPRNIGHGLNLQEGGHHLTWFSPPWSRELYDQLNARLVRRGQKETTRIYRLLSPGTIDEAVVETLRQRDLGQKALLDTLTNYRRMLEAA